MKIEWKTEKRKLGDLIEWDKNPRQLSDHDEAEISTSLEKFGLADPIVINLDNQIIGGHQRRKVMLASGLTENDLVDVRVPSRQLTPKEAEELAIRLNRNKGDWDFELLSDFDLDSLTDYGFTLGELQLGGIDIEFKEPDEMPAEPEPEIDQLQELNKKWGVQVGDLWKIGAHRLICGDCADQTAIDRLMGDETIRLCVTSPPYADQRDYELEGFDWLSTMNGFMDCLKIGDPCDILVNLGLNHQSGKVDRYWDPWLDYCSEIGLDLYGWYVWDKGHGFPGEYHGRLGNSHEFVFHFNFGRQANKWVEKSDESSKRAQYGGINFRVKDGGRKKAHSKDKMFQPYKIPDSVIRITREVRFGTVAQFHPALFPIAFAEFFIRTWSNENDIVYEPFAGGGTTGVACERLNRKARMVEISPNYCAIILERMSNIDLEPELISRT